MRRTFVITSITFLCILATFLYLWRGPTNDSGTGTSAESAAPYTIADSTGDWGYPTPYGMYPRGPGYVRMSFIFDTLIRKDRDGFTGALAKEWDYDEANNTHTFVLRDDIKWHDGEDLTAQDVVFTFDYMKRHPWPWAKLDVVEDVHADSSHTVSIELSQPYAPFLTNLAGTIPILPQHIWHDVDQPQKFRGPKAIIGSGPYRLLDYNPAHGSYRYAAQENYYLGKPDVERIHFVKHSEEMTPSAIRNGAVSAGTVPPESIEPLENAGYTVVRQAPVWAAKLMINHQAPPLSQLTMRRAIAYAIDQERIVDIICRGHGAAGSAGLIPPANERWHNPAVSGYPQDAKKSQELLQTLGYTRNEDDIFQKDGEELRFELLVAPDRQNFGRLAELLEDQLRHAGMDLQVRAVESKTLDSMLSNHQFELAISGHGGLGGDPEILNKMILGDSFNSARYRRDRELKDLLKKQIGATDPKTRRTLVSRIQRLYARKVPAITLYHPTWYWAHDGRVSLHRTPGGLAQGIPIPLNKLLFVRSHRP
ncbi:MAG: ABC transporter substrate-binding protein [Planctomycetota bacterium]